jgi:tRNA(fMet)-specific endonuclease VapC
VTRYLLDTNILSDLVRNPQGRIADRIRSVGEDAVCTSIIAAAELRFGAAKRQSQRLTTNVRVVLSGLDIVAFEAPADIIYAELRTRLESQGTPIGANDLLIAAHSLSIACTLITDNEREFRRVEGLLFDNWLR